MPEFQIEGDIIIAGSRIIVPVALATVLPGVTVPISGTVSATIGGGGTVTVASVQSPVTVQGTVTTIGGGGGGGGGTVYAGYRQTTIVGGSQISSPVTATLQAQAYQDLVVDYSFGSVIGTVQVSVLGVEPQSGALSSTIVAGNVLTGPLGPTTQRLQAVGPLGGQVAVYVSIVGGTVIGAYVTAEQSSGN